MGYYQMDRDFLLRMGKDAKLSGADWRVMAVIVAGIQLPGDAAKAGTRTLSLATGLHAQTVKVTRSRLIERGYLIPAGHNEDGVMMVQLVDAQAQGGSEMTTGSQSATGSEMTTSPEVKSLPPSPQYIISETDTHTDNANSPSVEGKIEDKSTSLPQGQTTPPPTPSAKPNGGKKKVAPKVAWDGVRLIVPDVLMASWSESHPHVDLRLAIKRAASWLLANPKKQKKNYAQFLNNWFSNVTPGRPEYIDPTEQAEIDAVLVRDAEDAFPDPDERADYFHVRKQRGLRVPPGVECRPMPDERKVI